ncbi:hypothetical protein, partial [Mesobacillus subterraneus]
MANENKIFNAKLWLMSLLLTYLTFSKYYLKSVGNPNGISNEIYLIIYSLFFILIFILIRRLKINIKNNYHAIFIILIIIFNWVLDKFYVLPRYDYILQQSLNYFLIFIISYIGFSLIRSNILNEILKRYYFIAFIVGVIFLIIVELEVIDRNVILNENTWGYFLAPFLIYLYIKKEDSLKKFIVYVIGIVLIYFT